MLKNVKIRQCLLGMLILLTGLLIFSNGLNVFLINSNLHNVRLLNSINEEQKVLAQIQKIIVTIRKTERELTISLHENNSTDTSKSAEFINQNIKEAISEFDSFLLIPGLTSTDRQIEKTMKLGFERQISALQLLLDTVKNFTNVDSYVKARLANQKEQDEASLYFEKITNEYLRDSTNIYSSTMSTIDTEYKTTVTVTVTFIILSFVLFICSYIWINRTLINPLHLFSVHLDKIGKGELNTQIEVKNKNEISLLFNTLKDMQAQLTGTIKTINDGVESIHIGTQEIAIGNTDLSSRTEQQSAAIVQTAASMEQISSTVKLNTDSAKQASLMISENTKIAQEGEKLMHDMVSKIDTIAHNAQNVNTITNVIDSIAFQTNILALNAAVEAARAGESGKGFSVVASEVRNLAQRSAASAKEISTLITQSYLLINDGVKLAKQTSEIMAKLTSGIHHVNDLMKHISIASSEQNQGIEQIRVAITQMEQVTQQNAALVEEVAITSTNVTEQSDRLAQAVSIFQLSNNRDYKSQSSVINSLEPRYHG